MKSLIDGIKDVISENYPEGRDIESGIDYDDCEPEDMVSVCWETHYDNGVTDGSDMTSWIISDLLSQLIEEHKNDVTITKKEYEDLINDSDKLNRLMENGVDNWEGYSIGLEEDEEEDE